MLTSGNKNGKINYSRNNNNYEVNQKQIPYPLYLREVLVARGCPQPALQDVFLYSQNCRFSNPKTILPFIAERVIYLATRQIKNFGIEI